MTANVKGVELKRAMLDPGSSINIISLLILDTVDVSREKIVRQPIKTSSFRESKTFIIGFVNLDLTVGSIRVAHPFQVIDSQTSYLALRATLPTHVVCRENPSTVVCGVSKTDPLPTVINFNVFSGHSDPHLYGKYRGSMLVAVGIDANDQLFSLAFAIVERENNDSWGWFMAYIRVRVMQRPDLGVISDRHRGTYRWTYRIGHTACCLATLVNADPNPPLCLRARNV